MDNIRLYLKDIKDLPLLTQKEEEDIAKRIRKGDKKKQKGLIKNLFSPSLYQACDRLIKAISLGK